MTDEELQDLINRLKQNAIDIEQLTAMVEYAACGSAVIKEWYEDFKNGIYH